MPPHAGRGPRVAHPALRVGMSADGPGVGGQEAACVRVYAVVFGFAHLSVCMHGAGWV